MTESIKPNKDTNPAQRSGDSTIKPFCGCDEHGPFLEGVEDGEKGISIDFHKTVFPADYYHLLDSCQSTPSCRPKAKKLSPPPSGHPLLTRKAQPSPSKTTDKAIAPKIAEDTPSVWEEDGGPSAPDVPEYMKEVSATMFEDLMEMDDEGFLTEMDIVEMNADGSAGLKLGYISPQTGDMVAMALGGEISLEEMWGSIEQDSEYLEELIQQIQQFLPEGWKVVFGDPSGSGSMGELPMETIDGKFVPRANENAFSYITLIPPTDA
ncbi:MAG: hypothetical protein HN337_08935 [Deltaproteobacteria bacterium]|jgi:hypothetical protein|nr:hypothetical protein [Deltaproteobacteria bacterium]